MTRNPYRIEPPFYVSFSGGRTSGYLLRHILDAWGGALPSGGHVLFANTGREHDATLDFVREVGQRWCNVVWVEYSASAPGYIVASHETASRNGEPFAALIRRKHYLPNPMARFCTSDLKVKPMTAYMRLAVGDDFSTVMGIRADEPRRVSRIRSDVSRDLEIPLADAGVTRDHVLAWWKSQPFDLRLPNDDPAFGNCDMCFLKGRSRIERVMREEPSRAEWWVNQEDATNATFRKDRPTYRQMMTQLTVQGELFCNQEDDQTLPCDCTE